MLNYSNYFLLVSLAIVSWIILCLPNSKKSYVKVMNENSRSTQSSELLTWPEAILYSVTSVNSSVMIYIACTLLGIFIIVNILKRRINGCFLAEATSTLDASLVSLKYQFSQLKLENAGLLNLLEHYKLEKHFLLQHVSFNKTVIQKLTGELKLARQRLDIFQCEKCTCTCRAPGKEISQKALTNCASAASIVEDYFPKQHYKYIDGMFNYESSTVALEDRSFIDQFIPTNCSDRDTFSSMGGCGGIMGGSGDNQISATFEPFKMTWNECVVKQEQQVNIVSTDQLKRIKGIN